MLNRKLVAHKGCSVLEAAHAPPVAAALVILPTSCNRLTLLNSWRDANLDIRKCRLKSVEYNQALGTINSMVFVHFSQILPSHCSLLASHGCSRSRWVVARSSGFQRSML